MIVCVCVWERESLCMMHVCKHVYIYICVYLCVNMCVWKRKHEHTTRITPHTYVLMYTYTPQTYVFMYTLSLSHTHYMHSIPHTYMYIYAYVYIHVHIYANVCIHIYICIQIPPTQLTASGVLAAARYTCSSTATTSSPACFAAAWCSGRVPFCAQWHYISAKLSDVEKWSLRRRRQKANVSTPNTAWYAATPYNAVDGMYTCIRQFVISYIIYICTFVFAHTFIYMYICIYVYMYICLYM